VAAGAVVGMAAGAVAGAAVASAARPVYALGVNYATVPAGAVMVNQAGINYYRVGSTWFRPYFGANGVYYTVVPTPY
jgi:hypothetical protein